MKKLLFIGHEYHKKTKSSDFMQNIFKKCFNLEFFALDPYAGNIDEQLSPLKNKKYDVCVLWQMMPDLDKLKQYVKFKHCAFFPMYDGAPPRDSAIWYQYRDVNIINFSKTLHDELKALGFSSFYFQFFPTPIKITNWGDEKSIFFWQRINAININMLERLIDFKGIKHIHFHHAIDPKHTFVEPSDKIAKKATHSTWFETREDMQKQMQKSAIYIAPRAFEGIGMSFLEAMAMGRCVIAPNNPTMNEYIVNGENGILYDLNDPKPVDLSDVRGIQKRTETFIKNGYEKWESEKWKIIDVLTKKTNIKKSKLKKRYSQKPDIDNIYKLFGLLPILRVVGYNWHKMYKLFGLLPFMLVKGNDLRRRVYVFGIPVLRILDADVKTQTFFEKALTSASKKKHKRNAVLLVDNIFEANANIQDNFTLFEYLYNQKKWNLVPYYLLHAGSPYRKELVKKYGRHIILFDKDCPNKISKLKMLILMSKLRYICDSFQAITVLPFGFHNIVKNTPYITSIFMQHGINFFKPDFITPNVYGKNIFDKVLVSNDMEKDLFIKRANFSENDIIKNGLMRWENVHDLSESCKEKIIFVFFTTRRYLSKIPDVQHSQYVSEIYDVLNKIKKYVKNVKIKIALHHSITEILSPILESMNIDIVQEDEIYNVKQSASLLITDYSSMCFEFYLQDKPVIFYPINDAEDCKKYGHVLDVVNPYVGKEDLLSNIISDSDVLIKTLNDYQKKNFRLSIKDKNKCDAFFYYKNDFCERMEKYLVDNLNKGDF